LASYFAIQQLLIKPWQRAQEKRAVLENRRRNRALVEKRRREAMAAVQLMQETVERKVQGMVDARARPSSDAGVTRALLAFWG
jgi:DnaJ family protein C protein 11